MIADAIEFMRRAGRNRPLIFVCTSPGFIERNHESRIISKFTDNLRTNYGLVDYVWVREFTGHGFPHFHFVADIPRFDPVKLSLYWSAFFDVEAKNSIRLGSAPDRRGRRKFYIDNPRMAWYMSKYIGKALGPDEKKKGVTVRTFAISRNARYWSQPVTYCPTHSLFGGVKEWVGWANGPEGEQIETRFNPYAYRWKRSQEHDVWFGFPNSGHKKS